MIRYPAELTITNAMISLNSRHLMGFSIVAANIEVCCILDFKEYNCCNGGERRIEKNGERVINKPCLEVL